jgi:hypothetical protein
MLPRIVLRCQAVSKHGFVLSCSKTSVKCIEVAFTWDAASLQDGQPSGPSSLRPAYQTQTQAAASHRTYCIMKYTLW